MAELLDFWIPYIVQYRTSYSINLPHRTIATTLTIAVENNLWDFLVFSSANVHFFSQRWDTAFSEGGVVLRAYPTLL